MARIKPIDVIKGISGKYGSGTNDYFATNSSSNRIHLAKYLNKPTGPATPAQVAQMTAFGTQQKLAAAWLRANRPSEENGENGTAAYQEAHALKTQAHLRKLLRGGGSGRLVKVLRKVDAIRTGVGSEVVVAAVTILS